MIRRPTFRQTIGFVVGLVIGGEPVDGCEPVVVAIAAESPTAILRKARRLGLWHPGFIRGMRPDRRAAGLAAWDPQHFVWRPGDQLEWRDSSTWPLSPPSEAS